MAELISDCLLTQLGFLVGDIFVCTIVNVQAAKEIDLIELLLDIV
jgi:hypothetical protein